ncbi:MAG: hypothetical protein Alpg2KO_30760 [Alphaproteobacteria bacterium]
MTEKTALEAALAHADQDRTGTVADRKRVTDFFENGVESLTSSVEGIRNDKFQLTPGKRVLAWAAAAVPFLLAPIPAAATLGAIMYMRHTKSNKEGWGLSRDDNRAQHVMKYLEKGVNALFQVVHNDSGVEKMPVGPTTRLIATGVIAGSFVWAPLVTVGGVGTTAVLSYTKGGKKPEAEVDDTPRAKIKEPGA